MMYERAIITDDDGFLVREWTFVTINSHVILDEYRSKVRIRPRKFEKKDYWSRLDRRKSMIKREDIEIPSRVILDAVNEIRSRFNYKEDYP